MWYPWAPRSRCAFAQARPALPARTEEVPPMKINHAIVHVFDFLSCVNTFAHEEIDIADKTAKNYIARHVRKALGSIDNKHGEFSADSLFAPEMRRYFAGERDFVDLSCQIGDYIVGELSRMEKSPSTDLLVVDFEDEPERQSGDMSDAEIEAAFAGPTHRYFAIMLLESKQAYMHELGRGEMGERTDIERRLAVLPNPSQKVASYAIIDLRSLSVAFQDKKRTIAGEERWLIPDGLLQCSMEASTKETFSAVTEIVEAVAEEYGTNTAVAMSKAKAYAAEAVDCDGEVELGAMAEEVFEDEPELQRRFVEAAEARELPTSVPLEREAVRRVAANHKIRTDTGIEITFPAEYSKNPEYLTFTYDADGKIAIAIKNITHIENR